MMFRGNTFNQASERFDGVYPASKSRDFTMIPSHEEFNASLRKLFILASVASSSAQESLSST